MIPLLCAVLRRNPPPDNTPDFITIYQLTNPTPTTTRIPDPNSITVDLGVRWQVVHPISKHSAERTELCVGEERRAMCAGCRCNNSVRWHSVHVARIAMGTRGAVCAWCRCKIQGKCALAGRNLTNRLAAHGAGYLGGGGVHLDNTALGECRAVCAGCRCKA